MAPVDASVTSGFNDMMSQWIGEHSWLGDVYFQGIWLVGTLLVLKFVGHCHPSRQCFLLLFLPVVIFGLGFFNVDIAWISWLFNPILCGFLLLDRFVLSVPAKHLSCTRTHTGKFSIQNQNAVTLTLQNDSAHPVSGNLADVFPTGFKSIPESAHLPFQLKPYENTAITYQVMPHRRGPFSFGQTHCRYKSPLGLLWVNARLGEPTTVDVYPDLRQIRKLRLRFSKSNALGELQKRRLGAEGTQFDSLRNYFPGDDVRKLAWQATARMDTPVVRVYTHEVEQPIVILVDAGRKMLTSAHLPENSTSPQLSKFDHALNAALAFASVALDRGDDVAIKVFHQDTIAEVPLSRGQKQFQRILNAVAHVQAEAIEPDYESTLLETARSLTKRSLIVLFTDLIDPLTSKSLVHSLSTLAKQHVILVATWQDEWLTQAIHTIPNSLDTVYQQGVRLDLLDLRKRTLQALSHHGNISVVDATPETLDERVIHHYVSLKLKNRV